MTSYAHLLNKIETTDAGIREEFLDFYKDFPSLASQYQLLNKIGEGTFSSVYKALDLKHYQYDNSDWCRDHVPSQCKSSKSDKSTCGLVALKRIYVTSSPERICNELIILLRLSGNKNIAPLIQTLRHEDQVIAVLPFYPHDDFRDFYHDLSCQEIQSYLRNLLQALCSLHNQGIIHRDLKPSNFLFNRESGTGVLVDFGLAQQKIPKSVKVSQVKERPPKVGYVIEDPRPSIRANRAGTRGFRAPEVLFKVPQQTVAIDMWSVGVIYLCLLSGMFPFFASNDDTEALLEISHIFGKEAVKKLAASLGRHFDTNVPSIQDPIPLKKIILHFNPQTSELPESAFNLLERFLDLNAETRITAYEALNHEFLEE